ncbi:MAG: hypothetical protein RL693_2298 [Verrucomicrobiota bacterium]
MKHTLTLFTALLLAPLATLHAAEGTKAKPNIIFVLFDDLGYGEPKCYRAGTEFKMPNMDRLAKEGMRFTDAHAAASCCTPTRYGVITGRYPSRIGQFGVLKNFSAPIIPTTRLTVASMMKQNGYDTACMGKWHLGMDWPGPTDEKVKAKVGTVLKSSPNAAGFDYFFGYANAGNISTLIEQEKVVADVPEVEAQPLIAKKTLEFLGNPARKEKPFFLYFALSTPHHPIVPAPEFAGKSGIQSKDARYGDWIFEGDWVLGQVLEALEKHKLADNTLIMVSSDNGAAGRSYAPLRGSKFSIYEGGHREPFLARWPGKIKAGSVCDDTICLNDLMATCAEIVGAKLPDNAGEDSVSILPDLLSTARGPVREATIHQSRAGDHAIRQGPWKLIFLADGKRELYNLQTDLSETKDVLAENAEVATKLTALMQRSIAEGRSTAGVAQKNDFAFSVGSEGKGQNKKARKEKKKAEKKGTAALKSPMELAIETALAADPDDHD